MEYPPEKENLLRMVKNTAIITDKPAFNKNQ